MFNGSLCCTPGRRNPQTKKHKTWDGDAILVASRAKATLYDIDGRQWVLDIGRLFTLILKTEQDYFWKSRVATSGRTSLFGRWQRYRIGPEDNKE